MRLTPYAWAKLEYLRDLGSTEIGGFGIARREDLLLVTDVRLISQDCDWASVRFDDEAVADFFENQVASGRSPQEFARIWIHTHPGGSAQPSGTDEETFACAFGGCDWAVMLILARDGDVFARIRFSVGPGGTMVLPVEVDYTQEFTGTDRTAWRAEYDACVRSDPQPTNSTFDEPEWRGVSKRTPFEVDAVESWDYASFEIGDF